MCPLILQKRNLRIREVNQLAQSHTATKIKIFKTKIVRNPSLWPFIPILLGWSGFGVTGMSQREQGSVANKGDGPLVISENVGLSFALMGTLILMTQGISWRPRTDLLVWSSGSLRDIWRVLHVNASCGRKPGLDFVSTGWCRQGSDFISLVLLNVSFIALEETAADSTWWHCSTLKVIRDPVQEYL